MSANRDFRSGLLLAGIATLTACASHSYGVSMTPMGNTYSARLYLASQGFTSANFQKGDELSMERRHGDSVDHVRMFKGGPSPVLPSWTPGSYTSGVPRGAVSGGYGGYGGSYGSTGAGSSGKLTIEITTYRLDRDGKRHAVEPPALLFDQADSVITLVTHIPSAMRK